MGEQDTTTDLDGLAARISRLIRRDREDDDATDTQEQMVPLSRLQREISKRKDLEARLEEVSGLVETLRSGLDERVKAVQEEAAAQVTALQQRHMEALALRDLGLDEDGVSALQTYWSHLDEDQRGDTPSAWWASQVEAHQAHLADPEQAEAPAIPRTLAPYLPPPEAEGQAVQYQPVSRVRLSTDRGVVARPTGAAAKIEQAGSLAELMQAVQGLDG